MQKRAMILAMIGFAVGLIGWRLQGAPPDLSSPKATVRSFIEALKNKDANALAACVKGAQGGPELTALLKDAPALGLDVTRAEIKDIVAEADGDNAKVAVDVTLQAPKQFAGQKAQALVSLVELFTLQKEGEQWRIVLSPDLAVADTPPTASTRLYDLRPLSTLAAYAGNPKVLLTAQNKARASACISNQKQLALGFLQYVQDYDEIFPNKAANYKDAVYPYIKNMEVFRCPLDAKGTISYTFNANLQRVGLAAINYPAQTVLTYEGKNMQLDFRHDGRAAVAFTDGHVKLIDPEAAKDIYWYPNGKTPGLKPQPAPKMKPGKGKSGQRGK